MPSFAGGEIGRQVRARYDVAKYQTALDKGRNTLGLPGGGQYNRPGSMFVDYQMDELTRAELFSFSFSIEQTYCIIFEPGLIYIAYQGGLITEPGLIITAATATNPLVMTIPDSGYVAGDRVYFYGVTGMTQINGRQLTVLSVVGSAVTFDVDASTWSAFTGSGGGVAGGSAGGSGGYPPPPAPGAPEPAPPTYPDVDPVTPPVGDRPLSVLP